MTKSTDTKPPATSALPRRTGSHPRVSKALRYYIIEQKTQGNWHRSSPSVNRYDLPTAQSELARRREYVGLDGVEDFRICEVEETVRPVK